MRFAEKVVIVTGSAKGIGLACARRFIEEGAQVFGFDVTQPDKASTFQTYEVSTSDHAAVAAAIADIAGRAGRIDVVVNNAGVLEIGSVTELSDQQWHRVIDTNLNGYYYVAKETLPHLVDRRGALVNVGSVSGVIANRRYSAYNTAKAAVHNLTRSLAMDYAHLGVRVNAVAPGSVDTDMLRAQRPSKASAADAYWAMLANDVPAKRIGTPSEIANVVAFLASDEASFIHGAVIPVDGGYTIQ